MRVEVSGPAPVEQVWARYTSPSAWPAWAPQIQQVTGASDPLRPGDRGWVHGPLKVRVPFEIRAVDHDHLTWSWWVGVGPLGVAMDHGVDSGVDNGADPTTDGSRAWAEIHAPRLLVAPYAPLARLALRRLVGG